MPMRECGMGPGVACCGASRALALVALLAGFAAPAASEGVGRRPLHVVNRNDAFPGYTEGKGSAAQGHGAVMAQVRAARVRGMWEGSKIGVVGVGAAGVGGGGGGGARTSVRPERSRVTVGGTAGYHSRYDPQPGQGERARAQAEAAEKPKPEPRTRPREMEERMGAGKGGFFHCYNLTGVPSDLKCWTLGGGITFNGHGEGKSVNAHRRVDIPDFLAINPALTPRLERKKNRRTDLDGDNRIEGQLAGNKVSVRALCMSYSWVFSNNNFSPYNHMATIASIDRRRLLAAWQSGAHEGAPGQHIVTSQSTDGGKTWNHPVRLERAVGTVEDAAVWSPVLVRHPDEKVIRLFYSASNNCMHSSRENVWKPGGDILVITSNDGVHWTPPSVVYRQEEDGGIPKVIANPPITLTNARVGTVSGVTWFLPFWHEFPKYSTCAMEEGAETGAAILVKKPGKTKWTPYSSKVTSKDTWLIEPSIVEGEGPNRLIQLYRTATGRAWRSISTTAGKTWGPPHPTMLPNPNSKMHALRLSNGALVMAHNHHEARPADEGTRTMLFVSTSVDEGYSWEVIAHVETLDRPGSRFHYPTLLERGCDLLIIYSVSHVQLEGGAHIPVSEGGIKLAVISLALQR